MGIAYPDCLTGISQWVRVFRLEQSTPAFLVGISERLNGAIWATVKPVYEAPRFGRLFETLAMMLVSVQRDGA